MTKILILGAGVMGTAISIPLSDNQHEIHLVGTHLDADIIKALQHSRRHKGLKSSVPESIKPYGIEHLEKAAVDVELMILGVNSLGVDWASKTLSNILRPGIPLVFLTKGLDGSDRKLRTLPDAFRAKLPIGIQDEVAIMAIGGPSIAGELAARRKTFAVITGHDPVLLDSVAAMMGTDYYHLRKSTDLIGVEIAVGMKNLYAIGVGIVQGLLEKNGVDVLEPMHNLSAALFTQSLLEIAYLVEKSGGQRETVFSLAGIGDLFVTCQGGRNFRMGKLMGAGITYQEAKLNYMPSDTVEGAELAFAIADTIPELISDGVYSPDKIPLLTMLLDVICRDAPFEPLLDRYFPQSS